MREEKNCGFKRSGKTGKKREKEKENYGTMEISSEEENVEGGASVSLFTFFFLSSILLFQL